MDLPPEAEDEQHTSPSPNESTSEDLSSIIKETENISEETNDENEPSENQNQAQPQVILPETEKETDTAVDDPDDNTDTDNDNDNDLGAAAPSKEEEEGESKMKRIELSAEFESFLELRDALERYQRENFVQLIVKDSKLLAAESTRKVIPKVYHLVNQELMYHSITYCCKCHGELKQKPNTRVKNVGAKRLNCPMYLRLRLTSDLQRLVIFDINETHNHGIDPNTCQMAPRQQVYALSRMRQGKSPWGPGNLPGHSRFTGPKPGKRTLDSGDVGALIANAIKDVSTVSDSGPIHAPKVPRLSEHPEEGDDDDPDPNRLESPLDSESSFSESEDDEPAIQRRLLPFPIRLIGSAIQSSPELLAASKQLIEVQKSNLQLERQRLLLQTKNLELANLKLELEVKKLEKSMASDLTESEQGQDTTIYLQAT